MNSAEVNNNLKKKINFYKISFRKRTGAKCFEELKTTFSTKMKEYCNSRSAAKC